MTATEPKIKKPRVRKPRALKPAPAKARSLLHKLEALAAIQSHGTDAEREAAKKKVDRLRKRFDFGAPPPMECTDVFAGCKFVPATIAQQVWSCGRAEYDVMSAVKWSLESATGIQCSYRNGDLLAAATPSTATKLAEISTHIAESFRALLAKFAAVDGWNKHDRPLFVRGLLDGVLGETRQEGQPLPTRHVQPLRRSKPRKGALAIAPGLGIHPYHAALELGRQIRFSATVDDVIAELDKKIQEQIENPV